MTMLESISKPNQRHQLPVVPLLLVNAIVLVLAFSAEYPDVGLVVLATQTQWNLMVDSEVIFGATILAPCAEVFQQDCLRDSLRSQED
jgi:hypothetical protein